MRERSIHIAARRLALLGALAAFADASGLCAAQAVITSPNILPSADQGDGTYRNPVLGGDFSDPDVLRVGDDFYLVASSFTEAPGLPILHSRDLVTWRIIGEALPRVLPDGHYATPRRGGGVWAPAMAYRDGQFLIYYPDPDFGIFVMSAKDPRGPWSSPELVDDTKGAIDPAPFWDGDGKAWLAYGLAGSRAGGNNRIMLKAMDAAGRHTVGAGQVVIDGNALPPVMTSLGPRPWQTTEGPKLYKRDGWYYIFVPSGGVKGGWQGVFRSRQITGPYEGRDVMDQGHTDINGPHQGAWVTTAKGEDWFLHFQDRDSFGRVVHLQPMRWKDSWPVIGDDRASPGRGEPVASWRKPAGLAGPVPEEQGQGRKPGWFFTSNPGEDWLTLVDGRMRLKSVTGSGDLYENGAVLSQRLPGPRFTATTRLTFAPLRVGERAGLAIHGQNFAWIGLEKAGDGLHLVRMAKDAITPGVAIQREAGPVVGDGTVWLRMEVAPVRLTLPPPDFSPYWPSMMREDLAETRFSYSLDGKLFTALGAPFLARPGRWVGARIGVFSQSPHGTPAAAATTVGYGEFDGLAVSVPRSDRP